MALSPDSLDAGPLEFTDTFPTKTLPGLFLALQWHIAP